MLPLWRRARASVLARADLHAQRDVLADRVIELERLSGDLKERVGVLKDRIAILCELLWQNDRPLPGQQPANFTYYESSAQEREPNDDEPLAA